MNCNAIWEQVGQNLSRFVLDRKLCGVSTSEGYREIYRSPHSVVQRTRNSTRICNIHCSVVLNRESLKGIVHSTIQVLIYWETAPIHN